MGDGRGWTRVVVAVDAATAELAADRLWGFGPAAIEQQDHDGHATLLAGFADPGPARAAADAVADLGAVRLEAVADDEGLDGWRAWAQVTHAPPFVIVPAWLDPPPLAPGRRLLLVDPAHTFGSGSHPTSRLVLGRLARLVAGGDRVLDVGCGSGILAVGAALVGAGSVVGIDVDPGAPAATAANASANGVADRVVAGTGSLADVLVAPSGEAVAFDVVAANLLAPIVVELASGLAAAVARGGHLVVSGLLEDRWADAVAAVRTADAELDVVDVVAEDGWVAVTLRR